LYLGREEINFEANKFCFPNIWFTHSIVTVSDVFAAPIFDTWIMISSFLLMFPVVGVMKIT